MSITWWKNNEIDKKKKKNALQYKIKSLIGLFFFHAHLILADCHFQAYYDLGLKCDFDENVEVSILRNVDRNRQW